VILHELKYLGFREKKAERERHTFRFVQLFATAHRDSSVINVPPMFRCCRE